MTASVKGSRKVKVVPLPRWEAMDSVPPSLATWLATTSMPMPRPAAWVSWSAVLKPERRMNCMASSSVSAASRLTKPSSTALRRIAEHVEAAAVVGDVDDDLGALAADRDADRARGRLAHHLALGGGLEAVDHRVAQHVLEGRQHLLQDLPVQVAAADDAEFGELALVLRRLAHQAGEPGTVLVEGHHAGAHQLVLQLGGGPGLLHQQPLRVGAEVVQQVLDAAHVAGRLGEAARQLLDAGVPVQFQRIELGFLPGLGLVAVQDLGLGLDLELAQLVPQADDGLVEFVQVELDLRELLGQAGIGDADLAGAVQQLLQQAGIHPGKVPGLGRTLAGCASAAAARRPAAAAACPAGASEGGWSAGGASSSRASSPSRSSAGGMDGASWRQRAASGSAAGCGLGSGAGAGSRSDNRISG